MRTRNTQLTSTSAIESLIHQVNEVGHVPEVNVPYSSLCDDRMQGRDPGPRAVNYLVESCCPRGVSCQSRHSSPSGEAFDRSVLLSGATTQQSMNIIHENTLTGMSLEVEGYES